MCGIYLEGLVQHRRLVTHALLLRHYLRMGRNITRDRFSSTVLVPPAHHHKPILGPHGPNRPPVGVKMGLSQPDLGRHALDDRALQSPIYSRHIGRQHLSDHRLANYSHKRLGSHPRFDLLRLGDGGRQQDLGPPTSLLQPETPGSSSSS